MFSQTNLTTRRQFLERSAWGFGSAFLLPSLLASCTDHVIPPTNPIPPVGDDDIDWNELLKETVTFGIGQIPVAGEFASKMVSIIWPGSGNGPWDAVRSQVEVLVNQKITDNNYILVTANLEGLSNVVQDYQTAINNKGDIKGIWENAMINSFDKDQPNFQLQGNELSLLPLFVQFANMYLAFLRDGVMHGASWGMNSLEINSYATKLTNKIAEFMQWAVIWSTFGRSSKTIIKENDITVEPFRSTNTYDRFMTMIVLDYMDTWIFYDATEFPNGAPANVRLFDREIYSDPYGNTEDPYITAPRLILLPSQANGFPTQLTVWGSLNIGAVQLTYPAGYGPNGVTTTARMGDQKSGNPNTYDLSSNTPILAVDVTYGPPETNDHDDPTMVIYTLQFTFSDGTLSPQLGHAPGKYKAHVAYDNYALSSIYIQGVNPSLKQYANCIVFGFRRFPHK